jgi:hypothetical protein
MNLLSLIQNQFSPQILNQISGAVGESPEGTKSALSTAFPALLGSLMGKASSPNGANDVYNMVKQGPNQGSWTDSLSGLLGGLSGGGASPASTSLLNGLLGSKLGAVVEFIASHCGIRSGSASSLLGMAAPLLMGTLGKHVASQGLGASGLGQFLGSQAQYLKDAIPSGLANTLGIGNLLKGGADTTRAAEPAYAPSSAGRDTREPVLASQAGPRNILKYAWVPLLLALGVWLLAHRSRETVPAAGGTENSGGTVVQSGGGTKLPSLQNLNLTPGSTADNLAKAIAGGDFSHGFSLQDLSFDNVGNLTDSARGQIQQLGSVLNAAPNLKIQITGHGQTQEAALGQANAIKTVLTSIGVSGDRITTSGEAGSGAPSLSVQ